MATLTLGELVDTIRDVEAAEALVVSAERSLGFGGNPETMERKRQRLQDRQDELASLRAQPTNIVIAD